MNGQIGFDRLKGRENYNEWKTGAKAYLISKGKWSCVTTALSSSATPEQKNLDQKALADIILLLDPSLYSYVEDADEAKKAWDTLQSIFEESGVLQKVFLLEQFILLKLSDCDSMNDYVNKKVQLYSKVKRSFKLENDVAGAILLCGLGETYKPLIMSIRDDLSPDYVKNLLLQTTDFDGDSENAMSVRKNKKFNKKPKDKKAVKCYDCGGPHFRNKCPNKNKEKSEKSECVLYSVLEKMDLDNGEKECIKDISRDVFESDNNKNVEPANSELVWYSAYATKCQDSDVWYVDSGATKHMTHEKLDLQNIRKPIISEVKVANNEKMKINHVGDLKCKIGENLEKDITLSEVHYIPDLCVNLLSVSQIVKNGNTVVFDKDGVQICKDKNVIASGQLIGNMFSMNIKTNEFAAAANVTGNNNSVLWHRRLAHINFAALNSLLNIKVKHDTQCIVCAEGKQSRKPFNDSGTRASGLLDLVHSDVCGPISIRSHGHARFFVTFIDDFSRKCFVYVLKSKGEVFTQFLKFKERVERETERKIKTLRTDNGTEYENNNFHEFFAKHGIKHEKSAPYSPQQNGLAERMNRTIIEKVRCMLFDSKLNKQFWAEAVSAAVDVINVIPNAANKIPPNEMWNKKKSNINLFRVFGCKAMVWQPEQKRKKLDAKSYPCVYLRLADDAKAYRLYDMVTKKIVISRDVIFMEDKNIETDAAATDNSVERVIFDDESDTIQIFPFEHETNDSGGNSGTNEFVPNESTVTPNASSSVLSNELNIPAANEVQGDAQISSPTSTDANESAITNDDSYHSVEHSLEETMVDDGEKDSSSVDPTFTTRARIDGIGNRAVTRAMSRHDDAEILNMHVGFAFVVGEPENYKEAVKSEFCSQWKAAMKDEFDSLIKNNTWVLVEKPANQRIVDNKWVFKIKTEQKNIRYKARLVARGFTQEYGVNYFETFAPVVRFSSIRLILALAAQRKMSIRQFDVKTAFLNGTLKEAVYMEQPTGFQDGTNRVCLLKKSLYGLKQSSRCWNQKFTSFIKLFGFTQSQSDSCVFISKQGGMLTILAIHVDDGLIVGENINDIKKVMKYLGEQFEIKEMDIGCFLGLEINQANDGSICIHQTTYAKKILCRFNMENCDSVSTPADTNQSMHNFDESDASKFPYRELVGSLMYLAVGTRPDIAYAVGVVSRFLEKPTIVHERAAKRILKYLKRTLNFGILFLNSKTNELKAYSDADYAGCVETRRSTSGYTFIYGGGAISWSSERQKSVSLSTAESEYIAGSNCVRELIWLRKIFNEILDIKSLKITLFMDNESAIRLIKNPEFHKRTKHIDIRYHFIREHYEKQEFNLEHVNTNEMTADVFTKALPAPNFNRLIKMMGVINLAHFADIQ